MQELSRRKPILKNRVAPEIEAAVVALAIDQLHQGRWCFGKTPMQTFLDRLRLAKEKTIAA